MTRSQQRFRLALIVLSLDALLLGALVALAWFEKNVSGDNILFMAAGIALGWGGVVLSYFYGTSESSAQKTEMMAEKEKRDA